MLALCTLSGAGTHDSTSHHKKYNNPLLKDHLTTAHYKVLANYKLELYQTKKLLSKHGNNDVISGALFKTPWVLYTWLWVFLKHKSEISVPLTV